MSLSVSGNLIEEIKGTIIEDKVNSYLTYYGSSFDSNASGADPIWQVKRIINQGNITRTDYANNGKFDQVWDDRASLFTGTGFFNQLSCFFDGVNDYVDFGNNYAFETTLAFSISMWIKPQNFSAQRYFISKLRNQSPSYEGYTLGIDTSGKIISQVRSVSSALAVSTFNTVLTADVWAHIVWVWTGAANQSGQKLYVNGILDSATPASAALVGTWASVEPLVLGRRLTANYFVGKLDEVAIYDKELNSTEVLDIFNAGVPNDLAQLTTAGNLKSWWRLGDFDTFPSVLDNADAVNGVCNNMISTNFVADVP